MSLFPEIDQGTVFHLDTAIPAEEIGAGFRYDHEKGSFVMVDGTPQEVRGREAVREWIGMMLRVKLHANAVFDGLSAGIDRDGLVGSRSLPTGFQRSELMREIRETLALCPAIRSADRFRFARQGRALVVSFTVTLRSGESMEVTEDVG